MMKHYLAFVAWFLGIGLMDSVYAGLDEAVIEHMRTGMNVMPCEEPRCVAASSVNETAEEDVDDGLAVLAALPTAASSGASTSGWVEPSEEERELDINEPDRWGSTALHRAVNEQNFKKVQALLAMPGIDVNAKDRWKKTALHLAVEHGGLDREGDIEIVRALLQAKETDIYVKDNLGATPFQLAVSYEKLRVIKMIMCSERFDLKKILNDNEPQGPLPFRILEEFGDGSDADITRLHVASANGNKDVVQELIDEGENVNAIGARQYMRKEFQGYYLPLRSNSCSRGSTPLHLAALNGHDEVVYLLINNGAKVDEVGVFGYTALDLAIIKKRTRVVTALIAAGTDVNAVSNYWKKSPLHLAALYANDDIFDALLNAGANVHAKNNLDETPLYSAAWRGTAYMINRLLEKKASVSGVSSIPGLTPLHMVPKRPYKREESCVVIALLMLEKGANAYAPDRWGETPLTEARFYAGFYSRSCLVEIFRGGKKGRCIPEEEDSADLFMRPPGKGRGCYQYRSKGGCLIFSTRPLPF